MSAPTQAPFTVGDRVRFSGYVIREKRDYWLNQGRSEQKSRAKDWLDTAIAARGTVTACEPGKYAAWTVNVKMDSGAEHCSLPGQFEKVENSA